VETVTEFLKELASKGVKLSAEAGRLNCYAQKGALTDDIRDGIIRYKSEIISLIESGQKLQQAETDKSSSRRSTEFPLSAGEKGLYILQKLHPEMSAYNVPLCFRINSELNTEMLAKAWEYALEQFPILTARVIEKEGDLYHLLDDGCKTTIQQRTVAFADDQQLLSFLQMRAKEPFDLNRGPLTRFELFIQDKRKSVLLLTVHHIVFDGASAMILLRSLVEFYRQLCEGKPVRLSPDLLGYQAFVAWEEAMLTSAEGAAHAGYWQRRLDGELPTIELLPDLPRPASASFEGMTLVEDLPEELSPWVHDFSKTHSLPPSVIFLAVFQLLLHRYTNQNDIIVGMPVMGRVEQKFAAEVGYFINMVPIRTNCEERLKLSDFLRRAQGAMLDALYHSSYPFPLMLDKLKLKQVGKNPVFQVTYAYQNFVKQISFGTLQQQGGLHIENVPGIFQEGDFDFGLKVFENEASFSLHLQYNPELYTQDTARRFIGHYCTLLREISESPDLPLHEYSILAQREKHQLLVDFNDTRADYPKDKCLHELFVEQVALHSGKTAVVCGDEELTYQQLYDRSKNLALYLQSQGVEPDCLVGLCMDRSLDMVVGLLGILQAGGAYVPLDPDYPDDRLAYMLRDSLAAIVLTQEKLQDKLSAVIPPDTRLIAVDRQMAEIGDCVAELKATKVPFHQRVKPHHLAYVIYTSGSTGAPKGVMVEHANVARLFSATDEWFQFNENDVWTLFHSYAFDFSVWEIWGALLYGGRLIVVPKNIARSPQEFYELVRLRKVTVLNQTPSAFRQLITAQAESKESHQLRYVIFGGEALEMAALKPWYEQNPQRHTRLINMYGITETTVHVTYRPLEPADAERRGASPIGRPIPDLRTYILDPQGQPAPIGVAGELYVSGAGVARGYLNRPDLTSERFVRDPFAAEPGARMYKTGDLGRWLADGTIEFLGRNDDQVKIRGFRIELGEIEARLGECVGIREAVVVAREDGVGGKRLVAYYTCVERGDGGEESVGAEPLRAHLAARLPEYMVPAAYVRIEKLPLTANGKLDRRELPEPEGDAYAKRGYEAPQGEIETALAEIWAEVLKLERVGRRDNFFELGGHSLSAVRLMAKINRRFKQLLPLAVMFTAPNIAALAKLISSKEATSIDILVPIQTGGNAPPIFGVPGAGGNVLSLQPLSRALGAKQPFYGLQAVGLDGKTAPLNSVEQTAKANIAALKTLQPLGPYSLIGHSYGGVVAYEMARILLEQGEQISSLILLDSIAPSVMQGRTADDEADELFEACMTMANLYGVNLKIDLKRLRQSSSGENVQYIVNLLNDGGLEINDEQFATFQAVFRANQRCYRAYKPSTLSRKIDVSLYRAAQGRQDEPPMPRDYGWNQLLQSPIRIYDVEANHFSILEKAPIQGVAGALSP
jgi:amino acid adenylation domain-containing protein